jgi:hypothetical protein
MENFGHQLLRFVLWFYGLMLVLGPIVVRLQFRHRAKVNPQSVSFEALPAKVQQFISSREPGITALGFERVAYLSFGTLSTNTEGYMALFSNSNTCEWSDISFVTSPVTSRGYMEFITRYSEDLQVDTNTNSTAGVLGPPSAGYYVYRFPQVSDAFTLYRAHRMLAEEKSAGAKPVLPPVGQEVAELKRRIERYGPLQQSRGFLYLDATGENYWLTWKGAVFGAWRSVWPVPIFRAWRMQMRNQSILRRIGIAS